MKKGIIHILIILFGIKFQTFGQEIQNDIKGHYFNGNVIYEQQDLLRERIYGGKTFLLQLKYKSGNIAKEYLRLNDSIFLYTEYFDSIPANHNPNYEYGKICEGKLVISGKLSGDTITYLNYDTYEQTIYLDTLLLPMGKWNFYYQKGQPHYSGSYKSYKRTGKWKFFDDQRNPTQEIEYEVGEIQKIYYQNLVADKSSNLNSNLIVGKWFVANNTIDNRRISPLENHTIKTLRKIEEMGGIGYFYILARIMNLPYLKLM